MGQTTKLLAEATPLARRKTRKNKAETRMSSSRAIAVNGIELALREAGGGLNYRNIDRNRDLTASLTASWQDAQIHQPSLFIAGAQDSVVTGLIGAKRVAELERVLPNLKGKLIIDGASHWLQQDRPEEVNAALIAFLKDYAPPR
jgi:pimeloyl-ACP methyl ester carboxylesterase